MSCTLCHDVLELCRGHCCTYMYYICSFSRKKIEHASFISRDWIKRATSVTLHLNIPTVKILKIGTPEIITIIVLQLEQLGFTVQYCAQKMQTE